VLKKKKGKGTKKKGKAKKGGTPKFSMPGKAAKKVSARNKKGEKPPE